MNISATAYAVLTPTNQVFLDTFGMTEQDTMKAWLYIHSSIETPPGVGDFALRDLFAKHCDGNRVAAVTISL